MLFINKSCFIRKCQGKGEFSLYLEECLQDLYHNDSNKHTGHLLNLFYLSAILDGNLKGKSGQNIS